MWKENAFVFKFPINACSALRKHIPEFFYRLFQQDRKDKNACQVSTVRLKLPQHPRTIVFGTPHMIFSLFYHLIFHFQKLYEHLNVPVPWIFPNFPVLPYGFYRFRLMSGYKELPRPEACFLADVGLVPKPTT